MSTRRRFENLQVLLDALYKIPYDEVPPSIWDAVQNVQEEFKDELSGDAINIVWSVADIQSFNDDNSDSPNYQELTNEDAKNILFDIERGHDAGYGITWTTIETSIDYYNSK